KCAVSRIFGVGLAAFLSLGAVLAILMALLAPQIAVALAMPEAAKALVAIAPALFLSAFTGAVRGLFQGHHNMLPSAVCEVVEAISKLVFGILLASLARARGLDTPTVAAAAILGITLGTVLSALLLALWLFCCRRQLFVSGSTHSLKKSRALSAVVRVALPVTFSAAVMGLVTLVDTALISARLQAVGFAPAVANLLYSSYGNLAVPLYNLVPALLTPVTLSLVPVLSAALARDDHTAAELAFLNATRLITLVTFPALCGLALFSKPLLSLLFVGQGEAVGIAAPLLSALAPALLPTALIALTSAALQAAGKTAFPVYSMLIGASVKLLLEAFLLGVPQIGILGAPVSTLVCNLLVLTLNTVALSRVATYRLFTPGVFWRPLLAALSASLLGGALYRFVGRVLGFALWQVPLLILLVGLFYALLALLYGAVQREDLIDLPCGAALCRLLDRCSLIHKENKNDKRRKIAADIGQK
ncbi:MAG: hypothetical protein E7639_02740, partial [Ruminococcaceae bacterium]|nr:hypothetical protein [Oscillospiraceae bacterium]